MNNFRLTPSQIKYIQSLKAKKDNASIIRELRGINDMLIRELNRQDSKVREYRMAFQKIEDAVHDARYL